MKVKSALLSSVSPMVSVRMERQRMVRAAWARIETARILETSVSKYDYHLAQIFW